VPKSFVLLVKIHKLIIERMWYCCWCCPTTYFCGIGVRADIGYLEILQMTTTDTVA